MKVYLEYSIASIVRLTCLPRGDALVLPVKIIVSDLFLEESRSFSRALKNGSGWLCLLKKGICLALTCSGGLRVRYQLISRVGCVRFSFIIATIIPMIEYIGQVPCSSGIISSITVISLCYCV